MILVIYALGQLAGTGLLAWRVGHLEKKMGNGTPGVYARRELVEAKQQEIERRLAVLEETD